MRRYGFVFLALLVAIALLAVPPAAGEAAAATPDLTLVSNARYDVQPEERRVRVTVDILATNRLRDTATRRFYFDRTFLAVPPGSTNFSLTSKTGTPSVRVSQTRDTYRILALTFGQRIYSQKAARFTLTFDMPDTGGSATREIRVGSALVAFPVWAFASEETPGSRVSIVFPAGYTVHVEAGELPEPKTDEDGRTIFESDKLENPLAFFAYMVADRPAAYDDSTITAEVGGRTAQLTIRAWPDDPEWKERVSGLMERGLPVLQSLTGLEWPMDEPLVVQETVSRTTGGYAGLFDPREGRLEVAYYADSFVVLHEAAHAWFNGALLADRWANEAFASYYAQSAGGRLGEKLAIGELTEELQKRAFPLNAWAAAGRGDVAEEDYGYAATLALARLIAERAGHDGLRRVWGAAAAGQAAYQPPAVDPARSPAIEPAEGPPDWRGLLDLLEERTAQRYDDLWREWVVREEEAGLLDERQQARDAYAQVLREAGRWELPSSIRAALRAWRFETATGLLDDASGLLDRRAELEGAAAAAGLRLPSRFEQAFESDAGFAAAEAEADAEEAAIRIVAESAATQPAQPDLLQQLGLWGVAPEAQLASAREAFAAGELPTSAREALAAQAVWQSAAEVGRNRALALTGLALLALLAIAVIVASWRGRRRPRPPVGQAAAPVEPRAEDPAAG